MKISPEGVLLVDKPPGPTSHDIVRGARAALDLRRIGHAGTLDPFASGLLALCLGRSTRIAQYLSGMDKSYRATARLGVSTSTHDPDGEVVAEDSCWRDLDEAAVGGVLGSFQGSIPQVPPRYSAKKLRGEAVHRRVRRGEVVHLDPVTIMVHEIELTRCSLPFVTFTARCSPGTYIRALARDLGRALGTGAHLTELRRTAVGSWSVRQAVRPGELRRAFASAAYLSPARALSHLPAVRVGVEEAARLVCGQAVAPSGERVPDADPVVVLEGGSVIAIGRGRDGILRPRKVFR